MITVAVYGSDSREVEAACAQLPNGDVRVWPQVVARSVQPDDVRIEKADFVFAPDLENVIDAYAAAGISQFELSDGADDTGFHDGE